MWIYTDKKGKILAVNRIKPSTANENGIWYEGDFSFFDGEDREGFDKIFKWDGEKPVIEYDEIQPEPEPTQLDRIEANTNAIMEKESSLDVLLGVSE